LAGPSGCGNSTLLNVTAGILPFQGGDVIYGGRLDDAVNARVGYITQKDNLLPRRTLQENVELPLEIRSVPAGDRAGRVRETIERVSLKGFEIRISAIVTAGFG